MDRADDLLLRHHRIKVIETWSRATMYDIELRTLVIHGIVIYDARK